MMKTSIRYFVVIAALTVASLTVQQPAVAAEPKVIVEKDPTLLTTNVSVIFLSGSLQDPPGKKGVANLLAQILLRGTRSRTREQFQQELEKLGGSISAATAHDRMGFTMEVISENTGKLLALLEDAIVRPAFDKKEFDSLKREITDKIQFVKNHNGALAGLALRRALFEGTPMELPEYGTLSTIKAVTLPDVVKYYNQYMSQANVLFGVAGPLDEAKFKKPLLKLFASLPPGTKTPVVKVDMAQPSAPKMVLVNKPKTETGTIILGQKGITAQDDLRYTLAVGDYAFGGEALVARLFKVIRSELGWTYSIASSYGLVAPSNQSSAYVISSTPSVEFASKALLKEMEMWKEYREQGLNKDELKLAHEAMVNSYPFTFATAAGRLSARMYSEVYGTPVLSPADYEKTIRAIDNKKIKEALAQRSTQNGWMVSVVADGDIFTKQLADAQKDTPEAERLKVAKVYTPEEIVR